MLRWAPYIRTLVHQPILSDKNSPIGGITIINPASKWPFKNPTFVALQELSKLARGLLPETAPTRKLHATRQLSGFQDAALPMLDDADGKQPKLPDIVKGDGTTSGFLMETLVLRPAIRNRNDVSYITIRTWRRAIKEHQISALRLLKSTPQEAFIDQIAKETADNIVRPLPTQAFDTVVAIPPGHSRSEFGFSEQIAARIAERMNVPYCAALTAPRRPGSSHPRKNATLQAPEISVDTKLGNVLLIDDVATSGHHIELAVKKLATVATHVTAIAWIGSH